MMYLPIDAPLAVVPILFNPLVALLAVLPAVLAALGALLLRLLSPATWKNSLALLWKQKLAVLIVFIIIGVVVGFFFFAPDLFSSRAEVSQKVLGTDWSLWRGTLDRRGATLDADDPAHGGIRWTFADGDVRTFYSSPAVVGNRVYVTSARYELFANRGSVCSIDADTGKLVWKYSAGGYRATFSSPSVSGKYLVVGEGLHYTTDGRIVCLDIERSEKRREGVLLWELRTKSHVESSPCITDGKAVIGAGDDGLYCVALEPGPDGKPVLLWHLDGKDYPDCEASPVACDGKVYMAHGNNGQMITCIDAKTGSELWRIRTPYPVFGSPSIAAGRLYAGMGTGNYVQSAEEVISAVRAKMQQEKKSEAEIDAAVKDMGPAGEVWCVDLATRDVLWKFKASQSILGATAAADGRLYSGSRDGWLYCYSTDGKLLDKWNARSPILTSPAVGRTCVYFVTKAGQLYACDRTTLKPVWEVDLGSESMSSPAVARGHVFVGTSANGLVCAGEPGAANAKPLWAGYLGGPGRSGWTEGGMLPSRGKFSWRYPSSEGTASADNVSITAPPALLDGAFYLGVSTNRSEASSRRGHSGLAKLQLAAGPANPPMETWFCPSDNPVSLSAAASGGDEDTRPVVLFVDGSRGDAGRRLRCVDAKGGGVAWSAPVDKDASGEFVITRREALIADRPDGLSSFPLHDPGAAGRGAATWSRTLGAVVGVSAVVGEIAFVAVRSEPKIVALDLPTGRTLWTKPLSFPPRTGPVFAGDRLWLGGPEGVAAYDLVTGEQTGALKCGAVTGVLVADDERLACVNEAGEIVVVALKTGEELFRLTGADASKPPVLSRDAVVYLGGGAVRVAPFSTGKSKLWFTVPAWLGNVTSPMVVVKSQVYFATDRMGLIAVGPREP
jgi:outer membrane protein assembly factor BamB